MSDIYMILIRNSKSTLNPEGSWAVTYTDEMIKVSEALGLGFRVFKLNNLTEVKEVKISYEEIPMELT